MQANSNISRRRKSALDEGNDEYLAKRAELVAIAARKFKESGYGATRLAEIGKQANMDRATVYYYFGSKEEIFRECLRHGVDANIRECVRIIEGSSLTDRMKLEAVIRQLMSAYDENYPNMYVYIQEEMSRITHEKTPWAKEISNQTRKFEQIVLGLLASLISKGELRSDIPVSIAANAIFGMLNWTHRWYRPDGPHDAKEVSESFVRIFFDGMTKK